MFRCITSPCIYLYLDPDCIVGFVETIYTVIEGDDDQVHVEVCVTLIGPEGDICDEGIYVEVFNNTNPRNLPPGSALASRLTYILYYFV